MGDGGLLSPEEATESLHATFPEESIRCTAEDVSLPGNSTTITTATTTVAETTTIVAESAAPIIGRGGQGGKRVRGDSPRTTPEPTPSPSSTLEPTPSPVPFYPFTLYPFSIYPSTLLPFYPLP